MVEDEFFHQLASGALADKPSTDAAPRRQPVPAAATGPLSRRAPEREVRRRGDGAARTIRPGRRRRRIIVALVTVAAVALVTLVVGAGDSERSARAVPGAAERGEPNGRPATDHARLTVWWPGDDGSRGRDLSARWRPGGSAVIEGRLTSQAGEPIVGARIGVLAFDTAAPEQGSRTVGEVRTDERGRITTAIALDRGAARKALTFVYLARSRDRVPAATSGARLAVTAAISAAATTHETQRGATIELAGRSPRDATISVLVREPGRQRWHVTSVTRASPAGRWETAAYVPSYGPRGTYQLRARTASDATRGFLSATSRPIDIRVR
jgi:hypothetical protein